MNKNGANFSNLKTVTSFSSHHFRSIRSSIFFELGFIDWNLACPLRKCSAILGSDPLVRNQRFNRSFPQQIAMLLSFNVINVGVYSIVDRYSDTIHLFKSSQNM
jgi:hypothetical protein